MASVPTQHSFTVCGQKNAEMHSRKRDTLRGYKVAKKTDGRTTDGVAATVHVRLALVARLILWADIV